MSSNVRRLLAVGAITLFAAGTAHAAISVTFGDVVEPPSIVGGRTMTAYDTFDPRFGPGVIADTLNAWSDSGPTHVTTFGGPSLSHRTIGAGWATWSLGYLGSVYYTNGATQADLQLSPATKGFSFYVEPGPFQPIEFVVTATGLDGSVQSASGVIHGDHGAALWVIEGLGTSIQNIHIESGSGAAFAIGRFGYNLVPSPGALGLLGAAGLMGRRRRAVAARHAVHSPA